MGTLDKYEVEKEAFFSIRKFVFDGKSFNNWCEFWRDKYPNSQPELMDDVFDMYYRKRINES